MIRCKPRPRFPFPPRHLARPKRMTLIGAFKCVDGAVLFADGQETIPNYAKFEVDKLYYIEFQSRFRVLMTAAGQSDAIDMLWERVATALGKANNDWLTEDAKMSPRNTFGTLVGADAVKAVLTRTVAEFTKDALCRGLRVSGLPLRQFG
jgi:hypothetical protein